MQVSVEAVSELNRKMTVNVPEEKIREEVESRLKSLTREVRLDGFRPGKAPSGLIRKRYGAQVRQEVLSEMIQSSFQQAVNDENLKPAGMPRITATAIGDGEGLSYIADFEVLPEFELAPLEDLQCRRFTSEVTDGDLDAMIQRLREQRRIWRAVERPAALNDQVVIHFEGKLDHESFTDGRVENFRIVLGSGQLIPGFEDKLVGAERGARMSFDLEFPAEYDNEKLAGKMASFDVEVAEINESVLPEVDADFVKAFGVDGDVEAFKSDVRDNMEREMRRALKVRTKSAVLDALLAANSFTLPEVLVADELNDLLQPYHKAAEQGNPGVELETLKERYTPLAKRRVALGLILSKLIDANKLSVDRKRVRATIEEQARSYENPDQVVNWYYSDKNNLREIENLVLEEQVVDLILSKAAVTDQSVDFAKLMAPAGTAEQQPQA
ncbi:trigger factor [Methylococcus geothermalis]|uniref:Trigger factor n=1 Tax=Methylococcus geothermalis TaxID=2681310 RepID=A0A858QAI0_9GAMM|nr:trigger factor [Methylococcus geothermalis]QJD30889.1 trigger factor [Methylococcus geothermalis]